MHERLLPTGRGHSGGLPTGDGHLVPHPHTAAGCAEDTHTLLRNQPRGEIALGFGIDQQVSCRFTVRTVDVTFRSKFE